MKKPQKGGIVRKIIVVILQRKIFNDNVITKKIRKCSKTN